MSAKTSVVEIRHAIASFDERLLRLLGYFCHFAQLGHRLFRRRISYLGKKHYQKHGSLGILQRRRDLTSEHLDVDDVTGDQQFRWDVQPSTASGRFLICYKPAVVDDHPSISPHHTVLWRSEKGGWVRTLGKCVVPELTPQAPSSPLCHLTSSGDPSYMYECTTHPDV